MIIDFPIQNFGPIKDRQTLSFEVGSSDKLSEYYVLEITGKEEYVAEKNCCCNGCRWVN